MAAQVSLKIDLYSDTLTKPTRAMREFMCYAEVGDEQLGEDPSVNQLTALVSDLLGKEDALFLPSGTMCNEISIRVHCQPGDEIIMDHTGHPRHFETGGPAVHSGVQIWPLNGKQGIFSSQQVREALRFPDRYHPRSSLVFVEQTSNLGGGTVWPLEKIREVRDTAHKYGLKAHLDGARLMNAVVASNVSAKDFAAGFDSVWIDLSKGLGAPVGAVLAGSKDFIKQAWIHKQQFGGAMRQAGILAAAGIYALTHHVDRLAEDHTNAQLLAEALNDIADLDVEPVSTNIVYFNIQSDNFSGQQLHEWLLNEGVRLYLITSSRLRAVTHLDVSREQIEEAACIIKRGVVTLSENTKHKTNQKTKA